MSHDRLADDLNRGGGTGGKGGRMPSQIMRPQINSHQSASLSHHNPGRVVADRKKKSVWSRAVDPGAKASGFFFGLDER
jgi:hypothetical protein